jgi:hypothetical protein
MVARSERSRRADHAVKERRPANRQGYGATEARCAALRGFATTGSPRRAAKELFRETRVIEFGTVAPGGHDDLQSRQISCIVQTFRPLPRCPRKCRDRAAGNSLDPRGKTIRPDPPSEAWIGVSREFASVAPDRTGIAAAERRR